MKSVLMKTHKAWLLNIHTNSHEKWSSVQILFIFLNKGDAIIYIMQFV